MTHFQDTLLWTIDQRGRQMTDKIYLKSSVSISKENFQNAEAIKKKIPKGIILLPLLKGQGPSCVRKGAHVGSILTLETTNTTASLESEIPSLYPTEHGASHEIHVQ